MGQPDRFNRDTYSRGLQNMSWDQGYMPPPAEESSYQETSLSLPRHIDEVLREYARIPGEQFFVAALRKDGSVTCFSSPSTSEQSQSKFRTFFDSKKFIDWCTQSTVAAPPTAYDEPDFPFGTEALQYHQGLSGRWTESRRPGHDLDAFEDESFQKQGRKRQRANRREADLVVEDHPPPIPSSKRAIMVGNSTELWEFYEQRFKNLQQTACKLVAKAWIKALAPKKQSTHPYTGKDEKAPDWWPQKWGEGKDERVRHKEPDHLYKKERVHLLCHILMMVVLPSDKQHKDIRKLYLTVAKLDEITHEALSTFFTDKDNPSNRSKKPFLKEIFKVALQDERFRAGQIDATTKIFVSSDDRIADGYASDNEEPSPSKTDEQGHMPMSRSSSPPRGTTSSSLIISQSAGPSEASNVQIQGVPYVNDMSVRGTHYTHPMGGSEIHTDQPHFVDGHAIAVTGSLHNTGNLPISDLYTGAHDTNRRSSFMNPHPDYNSPTTPIYSQWSATSAAAASSMYTIPDHQSSSHSTFGQHGTSMSHAQQYLGPPYEGLARIHDASQVPLFRPGSVDQGQSSHPPGFSNFIPQDSRGLPGSNIKLETLPRGM